VAPLVSVTQVALEVRLSQPTNFIDYKKEGREEFAQLQAAMTRDWHERLKQSGVNVEEYVKGRERAYQRRWREALVYTEGPSTILDIGGGNIHEGIFGMLRSEGHTYYGIDIDQTIIEANRIRGARHGIPENHFAVGENTSFPFEGIQFDLVFSSHCLEHSLDIKQSFAAIRGVLKPGGVLFFAVPIGWDFSREHLYFMDVDEWIAFTNESGFTVRAHTIGSFYPESGHDLAIVATPNP
jgi:SAM-dependent methyltransferase